MVEASMQCGRDCLAVDIDGSSVLCSHFLLDIELQYKGSVARMKLVYDNILKEVSNKDASFSGDFKGFYSVTCK